MRLRTEENRAIDSWAVRGGRSFMTEQPDTETQLFTALEQAIGVVRELRAENISLRTRIADLEAQLRGRNEQT